MNPNEMMSVEEALDCVLSHVSPLEVETVSLLDAVGRVVAEDLVSDCDITPFDHAAMDGFAVRAADLMNASDSMGCLSRCYRFFFFATFVDGFDK